VRLFHLFERRGEGKETGMGNGAAGQSLGFTMRSRVWRLFMVGILVAVSLLSTFRATPVHAMSIFFNGYGGDSYTTYGPNATVAISGDLAGTPDACISLGEYAANVYIRPHGGTDPAVRSEMPPQPDDVIISDFTGGLFEDETIGFTTPSGNLVAGNWDIVLDVCGDGFYDPGVDYLYGADMPNGAFSVVIPTGIPLLPSADILALKANARNEASQWNTSALSSAALFALYDAYNIWSDLADPGESLEDQLIYGTNFYLDWGCLAMPNPQNAPATPWCPTEGWNDVMGLQFQVVKLQLAEASHYQAIANDPPDADDSTLVTLAPTETVNPNTSDPLEAAYTSLGSQVSTESATLDALRHAIEKYQGADQAGDGQAALLQAETIQQYAIQAAQGINTTNTLLDNVIAQVNASGKDFDGEAGFTADLQQRLATTGFSPDEVTSLKAAGLSETDISTLLGLLSTSATQQTDVPYPLDGYDVYGSVPENFQQQQALNSNAAAALQQLATDLTPLIEYLQSQISAPNLPSANAGGPYSGTVGTPIQFDASASTTPADTGSLTYAWDLLGNGTFADASGANPTFTFTAPRSGLVGVKVTNDTGQSSVAYVPISVAAVNQRPSITAATPDDSVLAIDQDQDVTFGVTASDAEHDPLTYQWTYDGTPVGGNNPGYTHTFTSADHGLHTLAVTVSDAGGSVQHTWGVRVPTPLVSIAVTPANPRLGAGGTQQFTATGTFADGMTADLTQSVTWQSSEPSVAGITTGGLATALTTGTSTISAVSGAVSGSTTLTVTPPASLVSIAVTPANPTVAWGATQQFTATGSYSDGSSRDLTANVTWASSVSAVASITTDGLATGSAAGTSTISATLDDVKGSTTLTISPPPLVSIAVTPSQPSISKGETQQFTAMGTYADNTVVDLTASVTWSSGLAAVATIDASGLASGVAPGTSTIRATYGGLSGSTVLTVTPPKLTSITITPANPTVPLGSAEQFTATGTFADNTVANITTFVSWESSLTSVATINATGLAQTIALGTSTITASSGNVSATTTITVPPAGGSTGPNSPPVVAVGQGATDNTAYYVDWTAANPANGTASGVIRLPDGSTVDVSFEAVFPNGTHGSFDSAQLNGGTVYWNPPSTWTSTQVPNPPTTPDILRLTGGNNQIYRVTLSRPIRDPLMALVSLGSGGNATEYDFDSPFTIVSQGRNAIWGGTDHSLVQLDGNRLVGSEGNGTIRFVGTFSTFSWTVPIPEFWHGFTFGIRTTDALAQPVTVDEGQTATNVGTWGDPDGASGVKLSASVGSIIQYADGTWHWSLDTADGPAETQTVTITATDPQGATTSRSFALVVNNVAPTATFGSNGTGTGGAAVPVSFTDPADPSSVDTAAGFHYAYACDGGSLATATYADSTSDVSTTCTFTDTGDTTVRARIIDKDDGYTEYTTVVSHTGGDTIPPTTTATPAPPANVAGWNNSNVTVTLAATDNDGGSGVRDITVGTTGAQSSAPAAVPGNSTTVSVTTDGETTITYFATDNAGNHETPKTISVNLDTAAPTISVDGVQDGALVTNSVAPTIAIADALSGVDTTRTVITLDGQPFTSGTAVTTIGSHTLEVHAADLAGNEVTQTVQFQVKHTTAITLNGDTTGDYHDPATLAATLIDTSGSSTTAIAGASVTLRMGSQSCTEATDASGKASCSVTENQAAGSYPLSATFAGDDLYLGSSAPASSFTVMPEETTLTITSADAQATGDVTVQAMLQEDGESPIEGRTIRFTAGGATVTGTTDAGGVATATVSLSPDQYQITATFTGDDDYRPASAEAQTLYVYQPTSFVIWGGNPPIPTDQPANITLGTDYLFWGAQWSKQVTGGTFPNSRDFKGYADSVSDGTWTSRPGNSSKPPSSIARYIGVIVTTKVTKQGSAISGNVAELAIIRVDNPSQYRADPGHAGSGVVVALLK
jgi:hypothetical protein